MLRKILARGRAGRLARRCRCSPPNAVDPQADAKAFRNYFTERFPKVPLDDFVNGPYSMDEGMRKQWEENEQFPPYDFALDDGKEMFATPFKNGKTYADCFPNKGIGIRQNYPYFDAKSGKVITLDWRSTAAARPTAKRRSTISRTTWPR